MWNVGSVPYLNAVPLLGGLERRARLVTDVPSALGPRLESGELDVALLPVAEALRGTGDGFVGRHGIASEGPVRSVLLFLRKDVRDVGSVLLDPASRTSRALALWVLERAGAGGAERRVAPAPGPDPSACAEDAVLVIGDPALAAARAWKGRVLDLGEAWTRETGLPFVYARWTPRKGLTAEERREIGALLDAAADEGLPRRGALARAFAEAGGRDPAAAEEYVRRHVRYRIGPREEEAIERFAAVLREQDARGLEATPCPEARRA